MMCEKKIKAGCVKCQNYFFGECLGGELARFIPRINGPELSIFYVELQMQVTKKAVVEVYAISAEEARLAVEADLERPRSVMDAEACEGEEEADSGLGVDVYVYPTQFATKGEYVAYENKIYSVSDFKDMISEIKEERDDLPIIADGVSG